ncbi:MAG: prolipoprotein diacylglyceryl transferase [Solirubrobacteraceae bacterium]
MQPELNIAGLSLKTFGLMFALAFLAAGAVVGRRLKERGEPVDWSYEMIFAALAGGLIGSRLYFLIENYDSVKHDLLGSVVSGSGLVWYGGAIGGAVGVLLWAWRRGMLNLALLDICAPGLAVGYAIGRIGCQLSGDGDYGTPSSVPWAMGYPHGSVPTPPGVHVHPTPIYETLAMGLVGWWLWGNREAVAPGVLFAWSLVLSGIERLLVEFIRRNDVVIAGLTAPQLESIAAAVVGVAWITLAVQHRPARPLR